MNPNRFPTRRENLLRKLEAAGAAAILITNPVNVTYLTGFSGDSSYLLLGPRVEILISDSRYDTQLRDECPGLQTHIRTSKTLLVDATAEVLNNAGISSLAFEKNIVSVEQHEQWRSKMPALELVGVSGWVEALREIKDDDEIAEIRDAITQAQRGFAAVRAWMTPEMTELQVAHELEHLMRRFGARRAAFEIIAAVGPRAALPHARPTEMRLSESSFVLIDWGATSARGYRSDLTRVLTTASIPPKVEELYRVVLTAQQTAIGLIRPGVKCSDVDAAARKVIEDAGFGQFFGHGLGHGIGLDIHEGPRLAATSTGELEAGMVVTVEPGIYLPDVAGVRIEDDVLVTPEGCEVLTSTPRAWETARWM